MTEILESHRLMPPSDGEDAGNQGLEGEVDLGCGTASLLASLYARQLAGKVELVLGMMA